MYVYYIQDKVFKTLSKFGRLAPGRAHRLPEEVFPSLNLCVTRSQPSAQGCRRPFYGGWGLENFWEGPGVGIRDALEEESEDP